jgi:hypothetical protein
MRVGRVQVVVETSLERGECPLRDFREARDGRVRNRGLLVQATLEIEQAPDRGARGIEPVEGEVQLLAVLRADEEVANGGGGVALRSSSWPMVKSLPFDFDIFSPFTSRCLTCSQ